MHVTVISPEASIFDGEALALVASAYDGQVGILPHHAPFMTLLGDGPLVITTSEGPRRFAVRGGFLQTVNNAVRIVAEQVKGDTHAS